MAPLAVLIELQFVWSGALVLVGVIVTPLALFALERDKYTITASHVLSSDQFASCCPRLIVVVKEEPMSRIELETSSLPRTRSTN